MSDSPYTDGWIPDERWQAAATDGNLEPTPLPERGIPEVIDPQLGVLVVCRRDGDIVAIGAGNGWKPNPTIAELLAMFRHPRRKAHPNCRCDVRPVTDDREVE